MSAWLVVTWSLCTCDDDRHEYPDCDASGDWSTDRGVAERMGAYIPASTPRHLLRRNTSVVIEVVHADDADPDGPVGEIPPTLGVDWSQFPTHGVFNSGGVR